VLPLLDAHVEELSKKKKEEKKPMSRTKKADHHLLRAYRHRGASTAEEDAASSTTMAVGQDEEQELNAVEREPVEKPEVCPRFRRRQAGQASNSYFHEKADHASWARGSNIASCNTAGPRHAEQGALEAYLRASSKPG